ncbi:MAG: two-component regulator propeller domain-containing protein [Prevotella sp.]
MRKTLLTILTLLIASVAKAQTGKLFNTDEGLSSSFAGDIYQDHDGFIWVSTRNGLNRYDGYNFKVFKKGQPGCEGMMSNYINTVRQSRDKVLYIGTQKGVQTYSNDKFQNVKLINLLGEPVISFVSSIAERKDGTIMIATSGNGLFAMKGKNEAHRFEPLSDLIGIRRVFESSDNTLWVLTEDKGVVTLKDKTRRSYFNNEDLRMSVLAICEDKRGNVYIGTYSYGLFVKGKGESTFRHIANTYKMRIQALYVCRNGQILMGLDGNGVAILEPKTNQITWNPYFSYKINLQHAKVNAFVEDNSGNIWFSMLQKGVYMQPHQAMGFGYTGFKLGNRNIIGDCCVTSTLIDKRGRSWVGTDKDGVYVLDIDHNLIAHITDMPSTILSLAEDKQGRIWAGAYVHGLGYIDPNTYIYNKVELAGEKRLNIFDIKPDSRNYLWIATMGHGLIRYNVEDGDTKVYKADENATGDSKKNALINGYINQLALSKDHQRLYVATTMGLCCLDTRRDSWVIPFGTNVIQYGMSIRSVTETSGKYLWYGTDDGLMRRDLETGQTKTFTENDGLPDMGIASVVKDMENNLWVGTDHGLCLMDEKTGEVRYCFYVDDGVQSNEFSDRAASLGGDGSLLFGGVGGITWFKPRDIKTEKWQAKVHLTNLIVNGITISTLSKSGSYTITDKPVIMSDKFELDPDDNTFSIQLSTLTYDAPEHIAYSYRINNEDWITLPAGQNEINFSHLPPGVYKFRIKADKNNLESEVKEFSIEIHSPWYQSTLAYVLYIALVMFGIYLYVQYRKRKEQDKLQLQAHIHAEEMNEAKIKFFMNISHEIRTPMTLIMAPLMSLLKEDSDPQRAGAYMTIKRNAERIIHLISQMMDLRKIEKGMMKLRMRETDLIGFVNDICYMFEYQAKAKKIKFTFHHEDEKLPVWIDLANFDKVLVNLLSNAFKYTPTDGKVDITVSHDDKNVTIAVCDTGEGIPKDKINKIFERFYQSETYTNNRHLGTGIGLDLTNSLVLLHHGSITAKNNEDGPGSTFTVVIPLGNAHLNPDEIAIVSEEKEEQQKPVEEILKESYDFEKETETLSAQANIQNTSKGTKPRIAIVEDDLEIQQYLAQELKSSFSITTYDNGQDALTGILKDLPDIVVSDIMMPIMDGTTLCAKIKNNIRTNMIPVVLLTAKSSDEDKLEGLETGADAYIVKPFNLDILRRTLLNLVASRNIMRNKMVGMETQEKNVENLDIQTADDKLMEKVMKVINANMNNADLSIDYIAKEVGLSRVHFYRKMKTLTNQSPHNFLRNIRMKQAARLFDDGHQNVNDVMYAVGYNNASSFSVAFKAVYGVAPREYIKLKD